MPYGNDPDDLSLNPIEEPVRRNDDLTVGQVRELGDRAARLREAGKTPQLALRFPTEPSGCIGVVSRDVADPLEELAAG